MAEGYTEEHGGQLQEKVAPEQEAEKAIIQEVIDNLAFTVSYEDLQRKAETEETEFEGVDMWSAEARTNRAEHVDESTGRKIPAKPTLSVNLLDQNIQQVVSEARQARLAVTVKPKNGTANNKTGNYMKGLVRTIQVESGALEVRLWALERTAKIGRGGWRIAAEFANDGDFDIDLREERILDYSTVYWDPYSQRADRSDAEWCLITDKMSVKERTRKWPTKPIVETEGAFTPGNEWFSVDPENPDQRSCRVGTYYKVVHTTHKLGFHPVFGRGWIGKGPERSPSIAAMPDEYAAHVLKEAPGTRLREVDERSIQIYTVDGSQILEQHPWHGRFIPIIELIGKEYFVRGKRRFKGIVANAIDILRAINVLISSATELAGVMPRTPYIMYAGQDEGFEEMWDDFTVKNYTRLYVNRLEVNGDPAALPQRQQTELQVNGLIMLLRMMHELYHAVTGSVAPQLRAVNPTDRSGKAIEALQRQGAAGTSNYLDNMATISMLYEGRVLVDAIPNYYDKPGRILYVSDEESDGEDTAIMLKTPFIWDKDGMPVPVPCPTCNGMGTIKASTWNPFAAPTQCAACHGTKQATRENMPAAYQGKPVEYVDFSDGEFKVVAAIDRSFETKQDEALAGMESLAQAAPQMVPMYADLWVRAMGFSGAGEIADRIKSRMPEGNDDMQDIPPELQGRFMKLQQQHQQAMQALQEAHKMLDTDSIKAAGQKEIEMIRGAVQNRLENLKLQGKMLQVHATNDKDERLEMIRGRIEAMQQQSEQRHEIIMQLLKELGSKEVERHSVRLHAEAAAVAEREAGLRDADAAARGEAVNVRADARKDTLAERAHGRSEASAATADQRASDAAARDAARQTDA